MNSEDFESMLVVTPRVSSLSEWILGCGCSYHMCQDKNLFYTLNEVQGGNVFMGNDHPCQTMGIRTLKLKMHDGIVRIIGELQYVPDSKKNLIFLVL